MKRLLIVPIFIAFVFETSSQRIQTSGHNSPAIKANNIKIHYGFSPRILEELNKIYQKKGYDSARRSREIKNLEKKYSALSDETYSRKKLTDKQKVYLGVAGNSGIIDLIEWAIYTQGDNSPAIFSEGDVQVWYGIPQDVFRGIVQFLEEGEKELSGLYLKLNEQVRRYKELLLQVKNRNFKESDSAEYYLRQGNLPKAEFFLQNDYYKSLALLKSQTEQSAQSAYSYGSVLLLQRNFLKAKEPLSGANELIPGNPYYLFAICKLYNELGNYDSSLLVYKRVLGKTRFDIDTLQTDLRYDFFILLAENYLYNGDLNSAMLFLRKAQTSVENADIRQFYIYNKSIEAFCYFGNIDSAMAFRREFYSRYVNITSVNRNSKKLLLLSDASILHITGNASKALEIYKELLPNRSTSFAERTLFEANMLFEIGDCYLAIGRYDSAKSVLMECLGTDIRFNGNEHPVLISTFQALTQIYIETGNLDSAVFFNLRAKKILDNFGLGYNLLKVEVENQFIFLRMQMNDLNGALERANELLKNLQEYSISSKPLSSGTLILIGMIYQRLKKWDTSISFFVNGINNSAQLNNRTRPATSIIYYYLYLTYNNLNKLDSAISYYNQFIDKYREFENKSRIDTLDTHKMFISTLLAKYSQLTSCDDWAEAGPYLQEAFGYSLIVHDTSLIVVTHSLASHFGYMINADISEQLNFISNGIYIAENYFQKARIDPSEDTSIISMHYHLLLFCRGRVRKNLLQESELAKEDFKVVEKYARFRNDKELFRLLEKAMIPR